MRYEILSAVPVLGPGYAILGVTLAGTGPIGDAIHLPLSDDITALYGLNGAGKTRVLHAAADALQGIRPAGDRLDGRKPVGQIHVELDTSAPNHMTEGIGLAIFRRLNEMGIDTGDLPDWTAQVMARQSGDLRVADIPWQDPDLPGLQRLTLVDPPVLDSSGEVRTLLEKTVGSNKFVLSAVGTRTHPSWAVHATLTVDRQVHAHIETALPWMERNRMLNRFRQERFAELMDFMLKETDHAPPLFHLSNPDLDIYLHDRSELLPDWVSLPVLDVGTTGAPCCKILTTAGRDLDADTLDVLLKAVDPDSPDLIEAMFPVAGQIVEDAREIMATVMAADAPSLAFDFHSEADRLRGMRPRWGSEILGHEQLIPLSALSSAHQNWVAVAISLALQSSSDLPLLVMLDEPERGLHRRAEATIPANFADVLSRRTAAAVLATHSPYLLDGPSVTPILVSRDNRVRDVELSPVLVEHQHGLLGNRTRSLLGLTPGALLDLMRVAILVEGHHDELVLEAALQADIQAAGASIYPLRGAQRILTLAESRLLFDGTRAPILLVIDNTQAELVSVWETARRMARANPDGAESLLLGLADQPAESQWLRELGLASLKTGRFDRLHLRAMTEPGVICYLPDDLLLTPGQTWSDIKARWTESAAARGKDPTNIKGWLRSNPKLGRADDDAIQRGVVEWAERLHAGLTLPKDLAELGRALRGLGGDSGV